MHPTQLKNDKTYAARMKAEGNCKVCVWVPEDKAINMRRLAKKHRDQAKREKSK